MKSIIQHISESFYSNTNSGRKFIEDWVRELINNTYNKKYRTWVDDCIIYCQPGDANVYGYHGPQFDFNKIKNKELLNTDPNIIEIDLSIKNIREYKLVFTNKKTDKIIDTIIFDK